MKWLSKEKWIGDRLCFYLLNQDLFGFSLHINRYEVDFQLGWVGFWFYLSKQK
jgi:hypothetical protein